MKKELRKMKKFRFQLLHNWIIENFEPCRVLDVGGGKGFLSFLLNKNGFECAVVDPVFQNLPEKYKDLFGNRFRILETEKVDRINANFEIDMSKDFDLIIGLHSHGSNMKIIDSANKYRKSFILLPCCVIDEPIIPVADIDWFSSLEKYAFDLGLETERFELNFRGQNKGFFYKIKP